MAPPTSAFRRAGAVTAVGRHRNHSWPSQCFYQYLPVARDGQQCCANCVRFQRPMPIQGQHGAFSRLRNKERWRRPSCTLELIRYSGAPWARPSWKKAGVPMAEKGLDPRLLGKIKKGRSRGIAGEAGATELTKAVVT